MLKMKELQRSTWFICLYLGPNHTVLSTEALKWITVSAKASIPTFFFSFNNVLTTLGPLNYWYFECLSNVTDWRRPQILWHFSYWEVFYLPFPWTWLVLGAHGRSDAVWYLKLNQKKPFSFPLGSHSQVIPSQDAATMLWEVQLVGAIVDSPSWVSSLQPASTASREWATLGIQPSWAFRWLQLCNEHLSATI